MNSTFLNAPKIPFRRPTQIPKKFELNKSSSKHVTQEQEPVCINETYRGILIIDILSQMSKSCKFSLN